MKKMTERRLQLGIFNECRDGEPDDSFGCIANNICWLYYYYLPLFKTFKLKKIVIEFSDELNRFYLSPNNPYTDIAYVYETFDFTQFHISDIQTKKELLLKSVFNCLKAVLENLEIDTKALESTYNLIVEKNFELIFTIGSGEKFNRRKTLVA